MACGEDEINNILDWLLEPENPSVRYFTLRHLLDRPENDADVMETRRAIMDSDPRLNNAVDFIISKRHPDGRWLLKHSLNGKMWADIEVKGKPSKWITLRALRVLKASEKGK